MFASVYSYGHLVTAAFSLTMALAFALSAMRVPNARADWWYVLTFVLTASGGVAEMVLSLEPSLGWARAYLGLLGGLILFVTIAFHTQYVGDVYDARGCRLHRRVVALFVVYGAVVVGALASGALDGGRLRLLSVHGARSAAMVLGRGGFALVLGYVIASAAVLAPVLLGRGRRRPERRMVAVPILLIPLMGSYELTISLGMNPGLPFAGYFAALAGLTGAFVLAERFRGLVDAGTIGGWQMERRLGGGGMADVFLARRVGRGVVQRVALKRLRPEYARDPQFVQQFLDEARLIARLQHPHIVALHDVGEAAGELYLAMELVDGPSLADLHRHVRTERVPLHPSVAVEVGIQIADALDHAHRLADEAGRPLELIHRDVSPQNILVTSAGHLKLADFGIARSADRDFHTSTGLIKGKLSYMAPEQVSGGPYDQRVDLWALGVVLFELITNERPYRADSDPALLKQYVEKRLPRLDALYWVPPELTAVLEKVLVPDPALRLATAAQLRDALLPMRDEARAREQLARLAREVGERDPDAHPSDAATVAHKTG